MGKRNALIAGATGLVGNAILQQLLANNQYENIITISRKPNGIIYPKLVHLQLDFDKIEMLNPGFQVDEVFCALGTTIKTAGSKDAFYKVDMTYVVNLGNWCSANGVKKFMVVSAMGANPKSGIFYNRVKGEMEAAVKQLNVPQKMIFRPSLLMGKRKEKRAGEKFAQNVMGGLGFLFAGPFLKYKPIHADVVAKAMIKAARVNVNEFRIYDSAEMQRM